MEISIRMVRTHEAEGRAWLDADEEVHFAEWRKAHDMSDIPARILPRLGLVAVLDGVDSAAAWLYLDNSVGVGFMEWLVSRPGLSLAESRECFRAICDAMKAEALAMGYGLILAHAGHAIARVAVGMGWQDLGHEGRGLALAVA